MRGPRQSWRKRQSADWTPPAKESKERRAGGGGKMTDFRTEDGGSLLRRPSDSGAMQEMKASASVNLPPLICASRSMHEFIKDNMEAGTDVDDSGSNPPAKGSIKAESWPIDPARIKAGRRRSSVVLAPFMMNPKVQQETLPSSKPPIHVEKRIHIKSMLPPISSQRQRQRRRKRFGNPALTGQTGSSSYIALWVDEPQSLLSRAKHFGSSHRTSYRRSRRKNLYHFPSGFKKKDHSYFVPSGRHEDE